MGLNELLADLFGQRERQIEKWEELAESVRKQLKTDSIAIRDDEAARYALMSAFYIRLREHYRGNLDKRYALAQQWCDYALSLSSIPDMTFVNLESTKDYEEFSEAQQGVWNDDTKCQEIENVWAKELGDGATSELKRMRGSLRNKPQE